MDMGVNGHGHQRTGRDGHGRPNGQKILGLSVRAKINLGKKHFPDAYLAISSFRRFLRRVPSTSQLHHIMDPPEIPNPVQVSKFSSFLLNSIWVFDYSIRNDFLLLFFAY